MAHQPMLADHWLEPDHNYLHDLDYKRDLIERQGKVVVDVMHHPTAVEGCGELLQEVADWLVSRFPNAFIWTEKDKVVLNTLTAEPVRLVDQGGAFKTGVEALKTISRLVQDDFLLALPSNAPAHPSADSQEWLCVGGLVAFPGFYLLSEKIGRTLHATHAPVPGFNEKLLKSVQRSLTRLSPSTPIERTSWELVDSEDLFWAPLAGPLPTCSGAKPFLPHHYQGRTDASAEALDPADMILRLDHQTFVKLPKSGMVAFGIHPMRRRLADLKQQPLLPNLLIKVHQESDRELMRYKAAPLYQDRVLPYLQSLHQHQVDSGLIRGDERVQDFRLYA
ncbi:hypothetical protein BCV70DRAFT_214892 [Testicularia cyperi]|uniref:Uncharacterized protein n=1 Tax=Testicularia cyperi TaxID=1882483 RepID=A0A317Y001_9BASI|nr:hypothetical protein BCV70DRAFT_214892 [Testicularia cyperi]